MNNNAILDKDRINEIVRLKLHEPRTDGLLNSYVQKAAEEFDLPIGLVSIVLNESQYFAASHGLNGWLKEVNGTPVEWSFCANSVQTGQAFIVENAIENPIVRDNPLVTMDGIRCYAGVPLVTKNGHVLGNFCVIGSSSRSFSQDEINKLKEYAEMVMENIEEGAAVTEDS